MGRHQEAGGARCESDSLIGGMLVGGDVQGISQRLLDIEKARTEAAKKKEEQEKESTDKNKEGSRGGAGPDGGD